MRLPILALAALCFAATATAQTAAPWEYEGHNGPLRWGKLDPTYEACAKGHEQSPINIRGARLNKSLQPIEVHYLASSMVMENNGHTVEVKVKPGSYIVANGVRYELEQFHFHHPSEEAIDGKLTNMDIHLVHRSADGKLAILAVILTEDRDFGNTVLAALWPHLPAKAGASETVTEMVNPRGLLPAGHGYWTYMGSLTTPPCTEGVRWIVFEQELNITRDQLRAFATLFKVNSRPVQDAHGRKIEANE